MNFAILAGVLACSGAAQAKEPVDASAVAAKVDRLLAEEYAQQSIQPKPLVNDEDFLRRVTLDLQGTVPSPRTMTIFGLQTNKDKRAVAVDKLLESPEFSRNWAQYWREVVYARATNLRAVRSEQAFEDWMFAQFQAKASWDQIATQIITATGNVETEGQTGLIYAQAGNAEEIASETTRIFLGIQLQCANCHDHPSDAWKREQFHEFAAFFPRVRVDRDKTGEKRAFAVVSFDRTEDQGKRRDELISQFQENPALLFSRHDANGDGQIEAKEARDRFRQLFGRMLKRQDANNDKKLSLEEFKAFSVPGMPGRFRTEHFMPDLDNPKAPGKAMEPVFFISQTKLPHGLTDAERRLGLAKAMTSADNPWFAKAYVNRVWTALLGAGFYTPVDDMGPLRKAAHPEVLEALSQGFIDSGYDVRWLYRTILLTDTYQRELGDAQPEAPVAFTSTTPTRLRSDQLCDALLQVLGAAEPVETKPRRKIPGNLRGDSLRKLFADLFGYDPSTPQSDLLGTVPQALFMMNNPGVDQLLKGTGNTQLAEIMKEYPDDRDALAELYMLVLSREPTDGEMETCLEFIKQVDNRVEAYEDLQWSLLNTTEFLIKR